MVVPLIPALVWRALFFRAVRKQIVAEALKGVHRGNEALRQLAIRVLAPQLEEDPRDFPLFYVAAPGEPPPPRGDAAALPAGGAKEADGTGAAAEPGEAPLLLPAAEDVVGAGPPAAVPPPPKRKVSKMTQSLSTALAADSGARPAGADAAAAAAEPARPVAVPTNGTAPKKSGRRASTDLVVAVAGKSGRQEAGASTPAETPLGGQLQGPQLLPLAQPSRRATGASSGPRKAATEEEADKLGAEARLSALIGGGFTVWMVSEEPTPVDDTLPDAAAPEGEGDEPTTSGARSRRRGLTPRSGRSAASGRSKNGARLLAGGASGPRSGKASLGTSSGARSGARAAQGPSGQLSTAHSARSEGGRSGVGWAGDVSLSGDDSDADGGGGKTDAAESSPEAPPPRRAAGPVSEAVDGAPKLSSEPTGAAESAAGGEAGEGASSAPLRKKRVVVRVVKKRAGAASGPPGEGGAGGAVGGASSADEAAPSVAQGGPPKKKIVKKIVRKVVPGKHRQPADGAAAGEPPPLVSPEDVAVAVGDEAAGTSGAREAARRRSVDFAMPQALTVAVTAPPESSPASAGPGSGPAGSPDDAATATAGATSTGGTGFGVFRSFFAPSPAGQPPATPGASAARSRLEGLFGGRSSGAKSSRKLDTRSHFIGDRGQGFRSAANVQSSLLLLQAPRSARRRSGPLGTVLPPTSRLPRLEATWQDARLERLMRKLSSGVELASEPEDLAKSYVAYFVVSVICTVFFMWTSVSTSSLQLFSCIIVDPLTPASPYHGRWLLHDLNGAPRARARSPAALPSPRALAARCSPGRSLLPSAQPTRHPTPTPRCTAERCFQGYHLRFLLGVGVPGIILVCFAVPAWIIVVMTRLRNANRLSDPDVLARFGFLYFVRGPLPAS